MGALALERAILGSVQRGILDLAHYTEGALEAAAADILSTPRAEVVVLTGFPVTADGHLQAETDGPVGAVQLAYALHRLDIPTRILTDSISERAVAVGLSAVGLHIPLDVAPTSDMGSYLAWEAENLHRYAEITHMVAVERAGPGADGRVYNMRGNDITHHTAPLHRIFSGHSWRTIGIGDGGNELGMGVLSHQAVSHSIQYGALIHCVVPADHLVLSGTSNWGATGLAIELAKQTRSLSLLEIIRPRLSYRIIEALHREGVAVDGVTGKLMLSVDGIDWPQYCLELETILPRLP